MSRLCPLAVCLSFVTFLYFHFTLRLSADHKLSANVPAFEHLTFSLSPFVRPHSHQTNLRPPPRDIQLTSPISLHFWLAFQACSCPLPLPASLKASSIDHGHPLVGYRPHHLGHLSIQESQPRLQHQDGIHASSATAHNRDSVRFRRSDAGSSSKWSDGQGCPRHDPARGSSHSRVCSINVLTLCTTDSR